MLRRNKWKERFPRQGGIVADAFMTPNPPDGSVRTAIQHTTQAHRAQVSHTRKPAQHQL